MARPQRNSVDYFPHPVTHGKKMFFIRENYGNDGYAVWFMLLEEIGKAEYHFLDLKDEIQLMYIYSYFKVAEDKFLAIINDLVKIHEFDKELWETEKILFNKKFTESVSDAYTQRSNKVVDRDGLIRYLKGLGRIKPDKQPPKQSISRPKPNLDNDIELAEEDLQDDVQQEETKLDEKRIRKATKVIADYFNILEVQQAGPYMKIGRFVSYIARKGDDQLDWLSQQFTAYTEFKDAKGFKHAWYNFTGTIEEQYDDGAWNKENWTMKLKDLKKVDKKEEQVYQKPKTKQTAP